MCTTSFAAYNTTDIYLLAQSKSTTELKKIENIDVVDSTGNTALCSAIKYGDVDAYNKLKEAGANTEHKCTKKIPTEQYQSFIQKVTTASKPWSFLGLGKWAWSGIGATVVAGGAVAGMGGGGSSSNNNEDIPSDENDDNINKDNEAKLIFTYSEEDLCPEGYEKGSKYTLSTGENIYKCDNLVKCAYNSTSCGVGYHETGNSCKSGEILYKECVANTCPYTTTNCSGRYEPTGNTCQSGNVLYKECKEKNCGKHAILTDNGCMCESGFINYVAGIGCQRNLYINHNLFTETDYGHNLTIRNDTDDNILVVLDNNKILYPNSTSTDTQKYELTIINNGNGNMYGIEGSQDNFANAKIENDYYNNQLESKINIANIGNGNVYGLHDTTSSKKTLYNIAMLPTFDKEFPKVTGVIKITNKGNGNIYGMQGKLLNNAFHDAKVWRTNHNTDIITEGMIDINNEGDGDVYGMASVGNPEYDYQAFYTKSYNTYSNVWRQYSSEEPYGGDTIGRIVIHNVGDGNVYGMFSDKTTMYNTYSYSSTNAATAYGYIDITNVGNGDVVGMCALNGYAFNLYESSGSHFSNYSTGTITISNHGTGNTYGLYGNSSKLYNGNQEASNVAQIILYNKGSGNVYGIYGENNSQIYNSKGNINIHNMHDGGDAYGIYATTGSYPYYINNIHIDNLSSNNAVGVYSDTQNIIGGDYMNENESYNIIINNIGNGTAIGVYGTNIEKIQGGKIDITRLAFSTNLDTYTPTDAIFGNAIGIYAQNVGLVDNDAQISIKDADNAIGILALSNTKVTNSGTITINNMNNPSTNSVAVGIYAGEKSTIYNTGSINIQTNGTAYGIYAESGAIIQNTGSITLNEKICAGGYDCSASVDNFILLNGSSLINNGVISASSLNLDDMGGNIIATNGAQFIAENDISGTLNISSDIVMDGFDTIYTVQNMIHAGNTSNLTLCSGSAMFDAKLAANGKDVVMTMRGFDEFTDNKSLAAFLERNYATGNNTDLFGDLKSISKNAAFMGALNGFSGLGAFNQFANEDLAAMREMNFSMNEQLFETSGRDDVDISGGVNYFSFSNQSGVGSGSYGLSIDRISDKWKMGYGMSMANISTGNDDGINRQNTIGLFYMPMTYTDSGYEVIVNPKIGFSRGEYNRQGFNNMSYEGYIEKRIFGLMNDIRYPLTFGNWTVAPNLGLNAIVYNQSGHEENKMYGLIIPDSNLVSVEAGLGLYAKYDRTFADNSKLSFNTGLMAYREFGDCYNIKLGIRGMDGTFDLYDNNLYDYRGATTIGFKYNSGRLNLYGNAQYFTDSDSYMNLKAGIRFAF